MRRSISTAKGIQGEDAAEHFLIAILEEVFKKPKDMSMNEDDEINYKESNTCWICEKHFFGDDKNRKVRDHCHLTGKYRGAAHSYCNLRAGCFFKVCEDTILISSCRL